MADTRAVMTRPKAPPRQYSANMEDYLEAIRTLSGAGLPVKVTQLSDALNVSKPSVTAAVTRLVGEGLVDHEKYGLVQLTPLGRLVADDVCRRHEALRIFLTEILGVSDETAQEDACKLEHHLSHDSSVRLSGFVACVLQDARGRPEWLEEFVKRMNRQQLSRGAGSPETGRIAPR
jgi:DtxR family transcriptional regulator, Mn-dependent transcriptional regulator